MSNETLTWLIDAVIIVSFILLFAKACINVANDLMKIREKVKKAQQEKNQEMERLEKLKALKWKK